MQEADAEDPSPAILLANGKRGIRLHAAAGYNANTF